jgi:spore coat polysaccharide biosynthesis predicted glycosyltransferase SpsG/RimJ/RimL family protein N-acetyltransferase
MTSFSPNLRWNLKVNPQWSNPQLIADEQADANAFISMASENLPEVIVLDNYYLTQRWVDRVRSTINARFVVLEDLRREWGDVEFVVNGNLGGQVAVTPWSKAQMLLGPRYAFLSDEYRRIRSQTLVPAHERTRVLIFAGGGDTVQLSIKYLQMASNCGFQIDVVSSSLSPDLQRLKDAVRETPATTLHLDVPSLAKLYKQTRLALGAGGTSSWERACLGVPSVVASIAENQVPICETLSNHGLATNLGLADELDMASSKQIVRDLLTSPKDLDIMSNRGMQIVDGLGALRSLHIIANTRAQLSLRTARSDDAGLLFDWANDPEVIENSKSRRVVQWDEHVAWLRDLLSGSASELFVGEINGLPVGQIRFDRKDDHVVLTYSIDQDFRGRGLGKALVESGLKALDVYQGDHVKAFVRRGNTPSCRVFLGLGFTQVDHDHLDFYCFLKNLRG